MKYSFKLKSKYLIEKTKINNKGVVIDTDDIVFKGKDGQISTILDELISLPKGSHFETEKHLAFHNMYKYFEDWEENKGKTMKGTDIYEWSKWVKLIKRIDDGDIIYDNPSTITASLYKRLDQIYEFSKRHKLEKELSKYIKEHK